MPRQGTSRNRYYLSIVSPQPRLILAHQSGCPSQDYNGKGTESCFSDDALTLWAIPPGYFIHHDMHRSSPNLSPVPSGHCFLLANEKWKRREDLETRHASPFSGLKGPEPSKCINTSNLRYLPHKLITHVCPILYNFHIPWPYILTITTMSYNDNNDSSNDYSGNNTGSGGGNNDSYGSGNKKYGG